MGNLQVGSRTLDMSAYFQHLRLTLTNLQRAAFMCGREPNFELSAEEKDELSKLSWDDFLTMTRSAINSKKHQRRVSSRMKFEHASQNNSDTKTKDEGGKSFSGSEDAETSAGSR
ncbi:hypothetical protein M8C21_017710 [Ambrosia artemisiifolia]|uniref:Uncharacterized protein n=1 Tax=Ambrosia artemisiifolia TaxID=4212 RepID=A0AAD5GKP7_AMBAR|nr:hypothetical protein M8C21_017710 [Ambrosia artemisiifolia]